MDLINNIFLIKMFSLLRIQSVLVQKEYVGVMIEHLNYLLYLPIDKDDEIENDKKKDELRQVYNVACINKVGKVT